MEKKSVLNKFFPIKNSEDNQKKPVKPAEEKLDKLEISDQASKTNQASSDIKNITEIKEKVKTNFYSSDKVIKKVSEEIYKEIKK
ncbi:MAG TPA: hypothetical protein VLN45_07210 [Ignavibacteriaceae bacterium]|nr:hypothetical protein [Ignavibacteriaceae bacterium]